MRNQMTKFVENEVTLKVRLAAETFAPIGQRELNELQAEIKKLLNDKGFLAKITVEPDEEV